MAAAPCKECQRRPKEPGRHRCTTCRLRHEPIGEQVAAARARLAMVPEALRVKRGKKILALAPAGTSWCAACQSFRDLEDFGKGATTCRACASARSHAAMVEKTYGITADGYSELLALQGGRCAICGARPKSKRLAVDHDHGSGAVRGLLCSRCNHDLLGAGWDSLPKFAAAWHYLNTPPAQGSWSPLGKQARLVPEDHAHPGAERPSPTLPAPGLPLARPAAARPRYGPKSGAESPSREGLPTAAEARKLTTKQLGDLVAELQSRGFDFSPPPF